MRACSRGSIGAGRNTPGLLDWWKVEAPGRDGIVQTSRPPKLSKVLALVGDLIGKEKKLMLVAGFFMFAGAACELAIPHFTSKTIFAVTRAAPPEAFNHHLQMLAASAAGFACFAALRGWLFGILNNRFVRNLRSRLFGVLMREEASFHDVHEPGELTSRLTSDCYAISRCIATNVNVAIRNLLQVVGGGMILVSLSPHLAAACAGVFSFLWAVTVVYGSYSRHSQRVVQDVLASSNACAEEAFMSSRVVRATGTEAVEQQRYMDWLQRLYDIGMRQSAAWGLYVVSGTTAHQTCVALSLLLGGGMVYQGLVSPEQLTGFIFYVQLVTSSSLAVCDQWGAIMEAVGASERVLEHLEDPPAPQIAAGLVPAAGFSGRVELRDVGFRYANRPEVQALKGINMALKPGRLTALVGLSGSGKSTLVALLLRLYDPTEGAVLLDGRDLRGLDATWFRSQIGVVSQEPKLLSLDISSNIAYGCPWPATQARWSAPAPALPLGPPAPPAVPCLPADVEAAAREANAHEFIAELPQGYATKVTDKLLSGGQRQRIILARALLRRPRLLVLDEATSALDAESEEKVQQALDRVMSDRGRTVLVIAHRLSTVRNADCIVVLDRGEIAEQGTHKELTALRGIYYSLVRRQQKGLSAADQDLSPMYPPLMSSFDEDGYEARNAADAAAAPQGPDPAGAAAAAASSLEPLPGQLRADTVPAPEGLAAAAGVASPEVVVALARSDASTAAK
ncbi:ABC transporter B family member, chloroplastic [Raphidocelis subcapitata]|uniref:ABC transporter B family member, chloroplastic n=1 Tax=Raphidocelis subcapitata TaxID=307507 RepID=A0A2V0NVA2_9CHLO|nr:ABC transporter B family member, chloroplastic [Raphidocelis subcapitata]|eukprot:GBF91269.1 ABC transporter B family member, chloroplastic [Raphidocelis subcapitata]